MILKPFVRKVMKSSSSGFSKSLPALRAWAVPWRLNSKRKLSLSTSKAAIHLHAITDDFTNIIAWGWGGYKRYVVSNAMLWFVPISQPSSARSIRFKTDLSFASKRRFPSRTQRPNSIIPEFPSRLRDAAECGEEALGRISVTVNLSLAVSLDWRIQQFQLKLMRLESFSGNCCCWVLLDNLSNNGF